MSEVKSLAEANNTAVENSVGQDTKAQPETTQTSVVATSDDTASETVKSTSKDDTGKDSGNEADESEESDESEDKVVKPKKGFEKRISKEIARKNDALREADYWRRVAEDLKNGQGGRTETKAQPIQQVEKPKFADYNDIETYTEAVTEWKLERKLAEREQTQKQQAVVESYKTRLDDFKKQTPDFDEVLASTDAVVDNNVLAFAQESEVGPAILYYLAENEDEAARINKMSIVRQLAEVGKLEAKLLSTKAETKSNTVKVKTVSKAPAPVKPVSGGTVTTKSLDDPGLSAEDWIKMRNKATKYR